MSDTIDDALAQAEVRGYVLNHQRGCALKDAWFLRCQDRGWPYVTVEVGRRWAHLEIDLISMDRHRWHSMLSSEGGVTTTLTWHPAARAAVEALWETELRYYEARYPRRYQERDPSARHPRHLPRMGWRTSTWSQFSNAERTRVQALADATVACLAEWIRGVEPLPGAPP